ncbi:Mut7-C RNAse domain-containing protein [Saccharicrinis sp. FJH54]|uniref:Mut7-C RNAse domain-containing protein n=1 Tax=Saccharicrinis sp. FJH54 TaxID=3344665 RepID=UPI0035D4A886
MISHPIHKILKPIIIRCYAELNDFLPQNKKQKSFSMSVKMPVTIEDIIVSLGIPLSEVDLILLNSTPVRFGHKLKENDYVSLYPVFEQLDISKINPQYHTPLCTSTFILDAHLGKLAGYLRMLGFDSLYRNDFGDKEIIETAAHENRIILTRDKLLLKSKRVTHGYYVRSTEKEEQLSEIVLKFDLYSQFKPFTRCMECNSILSPKAKSEILNMVEPDTAEIYDEFYFCSSCDKVFWKGSHFKRMEAFIKGI